MKKVIFYIIAILGIGVVLFLIINRKYILNRHPSYKIYNEKGENVPITLFKRDVMDYYQNGDGGELHYEQVLLYTDERVGMKFKNLIILTPSLPYLRGGPVSYFYNIGDYFLYQHERSYLAYEFAGLYGDPVYYFGDKEPYIKFFIAKGNKYMFNTFGGLRNFGDTLIIEKLDGNVEVEYEFHAKDMHESFWE